MEISKQMNIFHSDMQNFVWQSFDFPGEVLLPGMKFRVDMVAGWTGTSHHGIYMDKFVISRKSTINLISVIKLLLL